MSNPVRRPELRGAIIQHGKIVGGLDLPEPVEAFLQSFAEEYARLGMSVTPVDQLPAPPAVPGIDSALDGVPAALDHA